MATELWCQMELIPPELRIFEISEGITQNVQSLN